MNVLDYHDANITIILQTDDTKSTKEGGRKFKYKNFSRFHRGF